MTQFSHIGLYAIVDSKTHESFGLKKLLACLILESTIPAVQLRLKHMSDNQKRSLILFGQDLKQHRDYTLILNDDFDLLDSMTLDGLHLGQSDVSFGMARNQFPKHIVGLSTHNLEQAQNAVKQGADYIGCGAVFETSTKSHTTSLGLAGLSEIVKNVSLPKIAIGGINESNIESIAQTGCEMAACISALIKNDQFVGEALHQQFLRARP